MMCYYCVCLCFFFFKQKTAYEMRISDWSSDVCSSDLVAFHLGHRSHDVKDELPRRPCRVDAIGDGSKADAAICQLGRKIDQPLHRPAKAIELPYDQHVPLASVRQRFGQASAVRLGSRCLVRESAIAACFLQRYELGRQILLRGRYARIAD